MDEETQADDDGLAEAKCAAMRWNTPLSEAHAEMLLDRLELPGSGSILDLGCGWGELLVRAVSAARDSRVTGIGVDTYGPDLERGRSAAAGRGLEDRVTFVEASAVGWDKPADRVLCIGATHAWGGAASARSPRCPRWSSLMACFCWVTGSGHVSRATRLPRSSARTSCRWQISSDARTPPAGRFATSARPTSPEWDDFETTWRLGRHRMAGRPPRTTPDAAKLRARAASTACRSISMSTAACWATATWCSRAETDRVLAATARLWRPLQMLCLGQRSLFG